MQSITKNILCLGGAGNLGSSVLHALSPYTRTSIDYKNTHITGVHNILLNHASNPK